MKLLTLLGLLVLAAMVHSVPFDSEDPEMEAEQIPTMDDTSDAGMDVDDENTEPSESFKKEVKEYFKEQALKNPSDRTTRQITDAIYHGDTIGLQSYTRDRWLGCAGSSCGPAGCPQMQMTGTDWTNCWGEVFKIYRASGPGLVRAGDLVGLYYPRESGNWFGCPGSSCSKKTCPGYPTTVNGFATEDKWLQCWGEVFRIYAKRKGNNAVINSDDDISLYYVNGQNWVAQGPGNTDKRPCLGSTHPPLYSTYDGCRYETLRIWKRED